MSASTTAAFCLGDGSVMLNGFASSVHGSCIRLFLPTWVLNSAGLYVLGILGCVLLAVANEAWSKTRERIRRKVVQMQKQKHQHQRVQWRYRALLALMYFLQMAVAYGCMLVAMTYEIGLFVALLVGFAIGYLCCHDFDSDLEHATETDRVPSTEDEDADAWRETDPTVVRLHIDGMQCPHKCVANVRYALQATAGVHRVHVDFERKCAFVSGAASTAALIDTLDAVGYVAHVDPDNSYQAPVIVP